MGACFNSVTFDGSLTSSELIKKYNEYIEELQSEHGSNAYNGTLTTCNGLDVNTTKIFDSYEEADSYIADTQQKWEAALAVKYREKSTEILKQPSFGGKKSVEDGQWHSMSEWNTGRSYYIDETSYTAKAFVVRLNPDAGKIRSASEVVVADQIPARSKESFKKKIQAYLDAKNERSEAQHEWFGFEAHLRQWNPLHEGFWPGIKKSRKRMEVVRAKVIKLAREVTELDKKFSENLYKEKTTAGKEMWLVGGWCSE